ncbi:hypothetical protein [Microbacterium sp. LWH3-1.2]
MTRRDEASVTGVSPYRPVFRHGKTPETDASAGGSARVTGWRHGRLA